jgi:uncharacterized protein YjlB
MDNYKIFTFKDDGIIPNNSLPVLLYRNVINSTDASSWFEQTFRNNNWTNNWRDIVLPYDHFHSNTHEVLGLGRGKVTLRIGGKNGEEVGVSAGDVIILPAGVGHYAVSSNTDYEFVGGYPNGSSWDLLTGLPGERQQALKNIEQVSLPLTDPVYGAGGYLRQCWKQAHPVR